MQFEDYEEIRRLHAQYALFVDTADFDALGELLDGALFGTPGTLRVVTGQYIRDWYSATNVVHGDRTLRTCHIATNIAIYPEASADDARSQSCFVVFQETPRLPLQPIVAGRYSDRFRKIEGVWRFTQRSVDVTLIGNTSEHLKSIDLREPIDSEGIMKGYQSGGGGEDA